MTTNDPVVTYEALIYFKANTYIPEIIKNINNTVEALRTMRQLCIERGVYRPGGEIDTYLSLCKTAKADLKKIKETVPSDPPALRDSVAAEQLSAYHSYLGFRSAVMKISAEEVDPPEGAMELIDEVTGQEGGGGNESESEAPQVYEP